MGGQTNNQVEHPNVNFRSSNYKILIMRGRIKNVGGAPLKEVSTEGKAKRVSYHTKRYTDWAKEAIKNVRPVDTVVTKEGPNVLERFDYTKEKGEILSSLHHKRSGFDSTDLMTARKVNEDDEDVVVGEEEAKERAAQFIVRMDKKGWKCHWAADSTVCNYQTERLALAQAHVYEHLRIWTYKCRLCGKTCRLETNFEKHLNTHGVTRRSNKALQYKMYDENEKKEDNSFEVGVLEEREEVNKNFLDTSIEGTGKDKAGKSVSECLAPDNLPKKRSRKLTKESPTKKRRKDILTEEEVSKPEGDEEQAWVNVDDLQVEEGRATMKYHTIKKAIFMPEEKARSVISSYIVAGIRKGEEDLHLECSLCQFRHDSEIEVWLKEGCFHLTLLIFRSMNMWPWST